MNALYTGRNWVEKVVFPDFAAYFAAGQVTEFG